METIIKRNYCIKGKENFFKYILLSRIDDLYSLYIQSKRYKKEIELMKKRKGIKMTILYQFVAENLVNYYYYSKPHKKRNIIGKVKNANNNYITNNKKNFENENKNENINENKNENIDGKEIKIKKEKKEKKQRKEKKEKFFYVDKFY